MNPSTLAPRMVLNAETAEELMSPNPISVRSDAALTEVMAFLLDHGFGVAPVIDEAGRPVGVVSLKDILVHHRRQLDRLGSDPVLPVAGEQIVAGFTDSQAREIMTPLTYTVPAEMPGFRVVEEMLGMRVHHLFVVDEDGILIGTISSGDILRSLRMEAVKE